METQQPIPYAQRRAAEISGEAIPQSSAVADPPNPRTAWLREIEVTDLFVFLFKFLAATVMVALALAVPVFIVVVIASLGGRH